MKYLSLLASVLLFGGCHKPTGVNWLLGAWVADVEHTRKQTLAAPETGPNAVLEAKLREQLLSALPNVQMTFSAHELIATKDGNGQAQHYEVISAPDAQTCVLKFADGKVETYHREGARLWMATTGSMQAMRVYFRHPNG